MCAAEKVRQLRANMRALHCREERRQQGRQQRRQQPRRQLPQRQPLRSPELKRQEEHKRSPKCRADGHSSERLSAVNQYADALQSDPALVPIQHLCISDVCDGHAKEGFKDGRALHAEGGEVLILIVSDRFEGQSLLLRQRAVNSALEADLLSGLLHSVQMRCWTRAQWAKKGSPTTMREDVPCSLDASPKSVMLLPPPLSAGSLERIVLPPSSLEETPSTAAVCCESVCECGQAAM